VASETSTSCRSGCGELDAVRRPAPREGAAAQEEPSISVAPSTGLADGQTVTVSGGPFPALVGAVVAQCAEPVDQTVESVVSRCQFSFEARFDAEGNLVPASLTVHEIITSVGGPLPGGSTTFDCTVDDCSVGVFGFLLSDNSTLVGAWVPIRFGPDVPTTRADCTNGGWRDLADDGAQPFRTQGQCVRFVVAHRP
jgi:hypothetical protein